MFGVKGRNVLEDFDEILVGGGQLRIFERESDDEIAQFVDSCSR